MGPSRLYPTCNLYSLASNVHTKLNYAVTHRNPSPFGLCCCVLIQLGTFLNSWKVIKLSMWSSCTALILHCLDSNLNSSSLCVHSSWIFLISQFVVHKPQCILKAFEIDYYKIVWNCEVKEKQIIHTVYQTFQRTIFHLFSMFPNLAWVGKCKITFDAFQQHNAFFSLLFCKYQICEAHSSC